MAPRKPRAKQSGKKSVRNHKPAAKSAGAGKRGRHAWRLYLLLCGAAVLLAGLLWLARREERSAPPPVERPAATRADASATAREQAEAMLAAAGIPAAVISREPADLPRHYRIRHRLPAAATLERLRQQLRRSSPPLVLSAVEDGVLTIADGQGHTLLAMHFLPVPVPPPPGKAPAAGKSGRLAIIMDDLGRGTHPVKQLLAIRQPVTLAILPGEPHAAQVAELAHAAGHEILLHVPMEPQGFPVADPGDDALLTQQPEAELRGRLQTLLQRVPHAVGVNNHMGSRFTEDKRAMATIMTVLRERGLFFVDSLTSAESVGTVVARQAGVASLRRDLFLDNVAEVEPIVGEIRRLAAKAIRNGSALGICHPYPETITALRRELPALARQGVQIVPVSALLGMSNNGR